MSSKPARNTPKSRKADDTPKKRWSAAERASRGLAPRRSGGRPRSERPDGSRSDKSRTGGFRSGGFREESTEPRFDRSEGRSERSWSRDDRGRGDRPERRGDRSFSRDDRAPRRDDRWSRDDRGRDDRAGRDDRGGRDDRRGGRSWSRDDRDRDNRGGHGNRDGFDNRGGHDDRKRSWSRDDRPERSRSWGRDDRPERSRSWGRDDRPGDDRPRNDRPRYDRDDRRGDSRGGRNDFRGGRDDRGPRSYRGNRDGFERRENRFERNDRDFDRREDRLDDTADQMDWAAPEIDADALAQADAATPTEGVGFDDLGVPHKLVRALRAQGITEPFPIQKATIPDAITGRDVLGRGRTGSGKTLGFGLPLLTRLAGRDRIPNAPGAVVLVPTRELAMQVADVLSPLSREVGLNVQLVAGGMAYGPQVRALDNGVHVLVATPGRLIDLMNQGAADLSQVTITVLDEADHMADLGFLPDVKRVLDGVSPEGQRMLFSATLDRGVDGLVRSYLTDPVTHEVDGAQASVTTMSHHLVHVAPADKTTLTAEIANRNGRSVLFVRTQRGADRVAEQLRDAGVMAGALHGGLTQGARSRILAAFKGGTVPVLVATDVAARGIHVDEVGLVLQVDPPADPKDYLHRAGRTARAGEDGAVVTLVLPHQRRDAKRLVQRAGVSVTPFSAGPDDEYLYRATGARKPAADPISEEAYAALIAPPASRPRRNHGRGGGRPYRRGRR